MTEEEFKALKPGDVITVNGNGNPRYYCTVTHSYHEDTGVSTNKGNIIVPASWRIVSKVNAVSPPMADAVNHPAHYKTGSIEVIQVIESFGLGFHLGNVVKYILRAGKKGGPEKLIEDLKKARWYLDRHISNLEKGDGK